MASAGQCSDLLESCVNYMSWNEKVMRCLNLEKLVGWNMGENVIGHKIIMRRVQ